MNRLITPPTRATKKPPSHASRHPKDTQNPQSDAIHTATWRNSRTKSSIQRGFGHWKPTTTQILTIVKEKIRFFKEAAVFNFQEFLRYKLRENSYSTFLITSL